MFEAVPSGCDAYVLKNILHDWATSACLVKLLERLRQVMQPEQQRLLICRDAEGRGDHPGLPALFSDMQMMVVHEGRERDLAGFERLLSPDRLLLPPPARHPHALRRRGSRRLLTCLIAS